MEKRGKRIFGRKALLVRLYVVVLVGILALAVTALLSQNASAAERPENGSVSVQYHGKTTRTTARRETVAQLLRRLKLDVSGEDVVSHGMEEPVRGGMEITVDRVVTAQQTYTTAIPHERTYCNAPAVPQGTEAVLTEGRDGELLCTADVTYINGVEARRQVRSETVVRAPVTEVVGVGTGEEPQAVDPRGMPVIADGYITLPTGEVLTYTDTATVRATAYTHTDDGCDFITSTGTTVRWGTVAVDPRFIPYGTRMFIVASNGSYIYGLAMAEDCGGDIKGDRMDLYMPTYEQCMEFGRRTCTLYFLG